jgi:hypothetical protein
MKVLFRSKDFASIEGSGFGFNNRRPMTQPWQYQGRVQHRQWQGTYECHWENAHEQATHTPMISWTVRGDERLFGLAVALKSKGFIVNVEPD